MAGLPASGKSSIARMLANHLSAVLLDKDQVRDFLFKDAVDYKRKQDDLCVNVMYDVASYHFSVSPNKPVILDGRSYSKRYQVDAVKETAVRANVELYFIECVCKPETARVRLKSDENIHLAKNRNYSMYERSRANADVITEPKLILDTDSRNEKECLQRIMSYLKSSSSCL